MTPRPPADPVGESGGSQRQPISESAAGGDAGHRPRGPG